MITKKENKAKIILQMVDMDSLVPINHLVRKIDSSIDFEFIRDIVKDLYSQDKGRPSVDPVVLFKIVFIQYLFGIKSMRQTIKEIEVNIAYRWFLGYSLTESIPHFSTFSKNYERRFEDNDTFELIFKTILGKINDLGFINQDVLFIDSTHIKAYANKRKVHDTIIEESKHKYMISLQNEINEIRVSEGKKAIDFTSKKKEIISKTDHECGMFHKGEKERQLAYINQVACDKFGWVIGTDVYKGNLNDNHTALDFVDEIIDDKRTDTVVMDAGYTSPVLLDHLIENDILPIVPYTRPKGKKLNDGEPRLGKHLYKYIEAENCYICPKGKNIIYKGMNSAGMLSYKTSKKDCESCDFKTRCTNQKHKEIQRHLYEEAKDFAKEIRQSEYGKELYAFRKSTIERTFALGKFNHNLGFTFLRGRKKNKDRSFVIFACLNLKKLAMYIHDSSASMIKKVLLLMKIELQGI